jgi:integrase
MAVSEYLTKKGEKRYKAQHWEKNQVVGSKSFSRKRDADEWLRRQKVNYADRRVGRMPGQSMTYLEFFQKHYKRNHGVRASTWTDYERIFETHLLPKFENEILTEIPATEWIHFFHTLKEKGMSGARLNRVRTAASALYKKAKKLNFISDNPISAIAYEDEPIRYIEFLTEAEVDRLLSYCYDERKSWFFIYHFLFVTGVRASELLGLRWDCVDFESKIITIRRAYDRTTKCVVEATKSGRIRQMGISSSLETTLRELMLSRKSDFVFCDENGQMLQYEVLLRTLQEDLIRVGLKKIGVHGFRHTFASQFLKKGGNLLELKDALGHAEIKTTMQYAHLLPGSLQQRARIVDWSPEKCGRIIDFSQSG